MSALDRFHCTNLIHPSIHNASTIVTLSLYHMYRKGDCPLHCCLTFDLCYVIDATAGVQAQE